MEPHFAAVLSGHKTENQSDWMDGIYEEMGLDLDWLGSDVNLYCLAGRMFNCELSHFDLNNRSMEAASWNTEVAYYKE